MWNIGGKTPVFNLGSEFWRGLLRDGADTFGWQGEHRAPVLVVQSRGYRDAFKIKTSFQLAHANRRETLDPQEGNRHLMIYCRPKFILLPDRKTFASAKGPIQRGPTPLTAIFHPLFHISSKFTFSLGLMSSIFSVLKVTSVSPAPRVQQRIRRIVHAGFSFHSIGDAGKTGGFFTSDVAI